MLNIAKMQGVDSHLVPVRFALLAMAGCTCSSRANWPGSCKTQIDVGFGDAVTPAPVDAVYPVWLDELPVPRLRAALMPALTQAAEN